MRNIFFSPGGICNQFLFLNLWVWLSCLNMQSRKESQIVVAGSSRWVISGLRVTKKNKHFNVGRTHVKTFQKSRNPRRKNGWTPNCSLDLKLNLSCNYSEPEPPDQTWILLRQTWVDPDFTQIIRVPTRLVARNQCMIWVVSSFSKVIHIWVQMSHNWWISLQFKPI